MGLRQRAGKAPAAGAAAPQPPSVKKKAPEEIHYESLSDRIRQALCYLWEPEDAAYLAFYRIFWGLIMMWEVWTHIKHDYGKMYMSWYLSPFLFKYPYFTWVGVMPEGVCKVFLWVMMALCACVVVGYKYRIASVLFAFGFAWMFFVAQGTYLNHFYLVMTIAFVLTFLPCNTVFSVDAYLNPEMYKPTAPRICLLSLQLYQAVVYFYAGVAKINEDWLRAEPLRHWLPKRFRHPFIGWLLRRESTAYMMSYGGMIYDLFVGFWLMYPPTLWLGIASSMFFHLSNRYIFNIGIFPMVMITSTTLYLKPDVARRAACFLRNKKYVPVCHPPQVKTTRVRKLTWKETFIMLVAFLFIAHQVVLPLRHWTYEGDAAWNELGHRYSWRMKLRDKMCDMFFWYYIKEDAYVATLDPTRLIHERQAGKMQSRPDMVAQFTTYAADRIEAVSGRRVRPEIYSHLQCRLNFREHHPLINSTYNLANVDPWAGTMPFVVPLPPLPEKYQSEYPWNWEWNFNWLRGIDRDTLEILQEDYRTHRDEDRLVTVYKNESRRLIEFLAERDHGGDVNKLTFVDEKPAFLNKHV